MSYLSLRTVVLSKLITTPISSRSYAKPGAGVIASLGSKKKVAKLGPVLEKKVLPVETDPERLVNYVCGSCIMKTGEDIKLKPDSEYPDWLWNLRTTKPPPFNELEYDTLAYWKRVRKMGRKNALQLRKHKRF